MEATPSQGGHSALRPVNSELGKEMGGWAGNIFRISKNPKTMHMLQVTRQEECGRAEDVNIKMSVLGISCQPSG